MTYQMTSVVLLLCFAGNLLAANPYTKEQLIERYPPEKKVVIQQSDGTKITGLIVEYQDNAVLLLSKKKVVAVPFNSIRKISSPPNLKPLIVIGAIAGGLLFWANMGN